MIAKWFKFYMQWVQMIRPIPDAERLIFYDMIIDTITSLMEDKAYKEPENIPPQLVGVADIIIETIKNDFQKIIEEREKKSKAKSDYWEKKKTPQEDNETPKRIKPEIKAFLSQFTERAQKELKTLLNITDKDGFKKDVISFYKTYGLTCINNYYAWAMVFADYCSVSKTTEHKNEKDARDHFHLWFSRLSPSVKDSKMEQYRKYLGELAKIHPNGKQSMLNYVK